jgi:hypothetical protein
LPFDDQTAGLKLSFPQRRFALAIPAKVAAAREPVLALIKRC